MTSSCLHGTVVRFFIIDFRANCSYLSILQWRNPAHESQIQSSTRNTNTNLIIHAHTHTHILLIYIIIGIDMMISVQTSYNTK